MRRIFERGQAYVAVSRATSLEGLQLVNFRKDLVRSDPKVIEFHKTLNFI